MATVPEPPVADADGRIRADVVVVGAGVAGLYAAASLPRHLDVVIVDKGVPGGRSGSSPWAQGGLAVAVGPDDSPDLHVRDTEEAGDGLCDRAAVRVLAEDAPGCLADIVAMGATFDRLPGHEDSSALDHLHLAREGGQSVARSVHAADATGSEMVRVLRDVARPLVSRLGGSVVELGRDRHERVSGVWVATPDGEVVGVEARATLLATGGCGGLYAATTNQDGATADGVTLALRAGAAVRDNEFVQFHPTGLAVTGAWRFLLTEALRGAGATLHDDDGDRFMLGVHRDAELAPRHVVSRAMLGVEGTVWLDATGIGPEALAHEFPTVLEGARSYGFDLATERVPVTPAAHYMVGGVRTDLSGRTSLAGLWAAGEVASTGLHGANRMAGNSLTEALVFGRRAARSIAAELGAAAASVTSGDLGRAPTVDGPTPHADELAACRAELRDVMWRGAGPTRTASGLESCLAALDDLEGRLGERSADLVHVELVHAVAAARLVAEAALRRRESRGGHVRDDHPDRDPALAHVHTETIRPPVA